MAAVTELLSTKKLLDSYKLDNDMLLSLNQIVL